MIGFALCGSFCTIGDALSELEGLTALHEVQGIVSENVYATNTRFGTAEKLISRMRAL